MNYLITGASGFVGNNLVNYLSEQGHNVYAHSVTWDKKPFPSRKNIHLIKGDILNQKDFAKSLSDLTLDGVFHLAAQASVKLSWDDPVSTYKINIIGTSILLEILKSMKKIPKLLFISSSEVYGNLTGQSPCNENSNTEACNPYGLSKIFGEKVCSLFYPSFCIARTFTMIGVGQSENFVIPSFCRQISLMKQNRQKRVLSTGNIHTKRYFMDVKDVIRAYALIMETGKNKEIYNIAAKKAWTIKKMILILKQLSQIDFKIETDFSKYRPLEPKLTKIDTKKITSLGWEPEISINDSLKEILGSYLTGEIPLK